MEKVTPVPVSVTVCVTGAVATAPSKIVSVAGPRAPVAVGVKITLIVHVPDGATGVAVVHVEVVATEKSVAFVPVIVGADKNVSGAPPIFVSVMV